MKKCLSGLSCTAADYIVYRPSDGKILDRISESRKPIFSGLKSDRAIIIADIPDTVTHVTDQTIPPGQRKKVVKAKKSTDITADTVAAVDALIADVSDKKTQAALKAIKALIVDELPSK